ncbi:uncharacterized protein EI97DRAFT_460387 [Westerdykella ornata]|uniref:Core Histone H2A/H2B/H3 domain-containing protein n=1 Tax=Westerdykella ornata TaxID=318751 RepID=A0A6A6JE36_WESOR|nr:uncharacterized protein EI97DRAFT_460387 [Westerdykella ornata]KAF2274268.1 hypothetical protein EI97DRAFT_460387 [Westerdykella ornata]
MARGKRNTRVAPSKARKSVAGKTPRKTLSNTPANAMGVSKKNKKKRRFKAGTRALMEIRRLQQSWEPLIKRTPLVRILKEVLKDMDKSDIRMQAGAVGAIQEAAEAYLVAWFTAVNYACIHAGRVTIQQKDFAVVGNITAAVGSWANHVEHYAVTKGRSTGNSVVKNPDSYTYFFPRHQVDDGPPTQEREKSTKSKAAANKPNDGNKRGPRLTALVRGVKCKRKDAQEEEGNEEEGNEEEGNGEEGNGEEGNGEEGEEGEEGNESTTIPEGDDFHTQSYGLLGEQSQRKDGGDEETNGETSPQGLTKKAGKKKMSKPPLSSFKALQSKTNRQDISSDSESDESELDFNWAAHFDAERKDDILFVPGTSTPCLPCREMQPHEDHESIYKFTVEGVWCVVNPRAASLIAWMLDLKGGSGACTECKAWVASKKPVLLDRKSAYELMKIRLSNFCRFASKQSP